MVHADVSNDVGSFISAAKFPSSLGHVPLFKFRQCEDYSEQSKTLLRAFDFCLSILTSFVCIFIEYSYIVWLRFHYNLIRLIRRSEFYIDSFRDQVKRFRSTVA